MSVTSEPKTTTGLITGVDIIAYMTNDPSRSIAFYRDVLGLTPTAIDDGGRGAEFTLSDGTTFGVWQPDDNSAPGSAVMFAVADIDAALTEFRKRGAHLSDPTETNVCYMAFGADPDGNSVIVHQRKSES
ncbi:MAG: VOC family protein [Candidatus Eremiobacteraeota bacterium]|nr:VOC family protein [Candidatus Eremiobacteraeota bacterium]